MPLTEVAAPSREGEKVAPSGSGAPFSASATGGARVRRVAFLAGIGQFEGRGVGGSQPERAGGLVADRFGSPSATLVIIKKRES